MQLSPVFCYVSLPGLYLARAYKMQHPVGQRPLFKVSYISRVIVRCNWRSLVQAV